MDKRPKEGTVVMIAFVVDYGEPIPPGTLRLRPQDGSKWSMSRIVDLKDFERLYGSGKK